MSQINELGDEQLLTRLQSGEHNFVERKASVHRDVIKKNVVAFANTVKWPSEGVLYLGVEDKTGKPSGKLGDLTKSHKDIRTHIDECYPPIPYYTKVIRVDNQDVIAVVVTESHQTPHFTGKAYVRIGDQTSKASEDKIQELVENRLSKVRELKKWLGKQVTLYTRVKTVIMGRQREERISWTAQDAKLIDVNSFWLIWEENEEPFMRSSAPLQDITLNWDTEQQRLEVVFNSQTIE